MSGASDVLANLVTAIAPRAKASPNTRAHLDATTIITGAIQTGGHSTADCICCAALAAYQAMKTPAGHECPYFYSDYHRGRNTEECRALKAARQKWTADLCKTCAVPAITRANACQSLKLRATVVRPWRALLQRRVQIAAHCEKSLRDVPEPQIGCGECHALPFSFEIND